MTDQNNNQTCDCGTNTDGAACACNTECSCGPSCNCNAEKACSQDCRCPN